MDTQQEPDKQLPVSAIAALHDGSKIEAIKIVREEHGTGLKEAKELVENYLMAHPEIQSQLDSHSLEAARGCLPWLIMLALVAASVIFFSK